VAVFDSGNIAKPVRELIDEYTNGHTAYTVDVENRPVTVLKGLDCIGGFGKRLGKYDKELYSSDSFVGIGRVVGSFPEIRLSYRDACSMAEAKFFFREGTAIAVFGADASDENEPIPAGELDIDDCKDKIFICIVYHEQEMIFDLLRDMEERFRRMRIKPDKALGLLTHVFNDMQERIKANYPHANARLYDYAEVCDMLYGFSRLSGVMKWIGDSLCRLSDSIRMEPLSDAVNKLEHYLSNFSYMNLSLESLAKVFGYNSSYLGQAFKKHAGESFIAYMDRIRISNAISLLADTDLKVYEISEKVGYTNLDHFHLKFKKITGRRPGECRKK
jgi:two-component system response regulator YesN